MRLHRIRVRDSAVERPMPIGWLRLVGSLKLQDCISECRVFYRALLQKRPVILRSLLIVATTYSTETDNCAIAIKFVDIRLDGIRGN